VVWIGNRDEAIKKRVHGEDDLTKRYLGKMKTMNIELPPPEDPTITTLWIGALMICPSSAMNKNL